MARMLNTVAMLDGGSSGSTNSFRADGKLFAQANSKINSAKTYISQAKELLAKINLDGYENVTNLKNSINNCGINSLTQYVENTKISLMKLDTEFAERYMSYISETLMNNTIDVNKLSEEERLQYNIEMSANQIDYYRNCLYILEKHEESGMLTDEMQNELKYYRAFVKQYDIQDSMIGLDITSDEYLKLFNQYADYTRDLIKYNPSLSDAEKEEMLSDYEKEYNSQIERINLQRELNDLYVMKEENSDFWHPFVEGELEEAIIDKKIQLGIATEDEIEYSRMNGWEKAWENTKTFGVSAFTGLMSVGESLVDGTLMLTAGTVGLVSSDVAEWTSNFVGYNYSEGIYDSIVDSGTINSVKAYSGWHTAGNVIGSVAGYAALSFLPGGAITTAVSGGVAAMGSSSQMAYQGGATHGEAYLTGAISGVIGAASGAAVDKIGGLASGATSMKQVLGYTAMGAGVSVLEPVVNTITEYSLYANETGNYENIWDYYTETGVLSTIIALGAGGVSVGAKGIDGYDIFKKMTGDDAAARSQAWERYLKQQYSPQNVEHMSGINIANSNGVRVMHFAPESLYGSNLDQTNITLSSDVNLIEFTDRIKSYGLPDDEVEKAIISYKKWKQLTSDPSYLNLDQNVSYKDALIQMKKQFGDGGTSMHFDLLSARSINDIINTIAYDVDGYFYNTMEGRFISSLTDDELMSFLIYTGNNYETINTALRNGDLSGTISFNKKIYAIQDVVDNINSALWKFEGLGTPMKLFRGTKLDLCNADSSMRPFFDGVNMNDLDEVYAAFKTMEGQQLMDKAFLSTSPSYETSFAFKPEYPLVFELVSEDGFGGAYINIMSNYYNMENEYLLRANTKFRIMDVSKDVINGQDKIIIKCIIE